MTPPRDDLKARLDAALARMNRGDAPRVRRPTMAPLAPLREEAPPDRAIGAPGPNVMASPMAPRRPPTRSPMPDRMTEATAQADEPPAAAPVEEPAAVDEPVAGGYVEPATPAPRITSVYESVEIDDEEWRREAFMRAAAVLWQFVPDELAPDDGRPAEPGEAASLLAGEVVRLRARDGGAGAWTLRDRLRPGRLADLAPSELLGLRALYRGAAAPAQAVIDRWWEGPDPQIGGYEVEELTFLARLRTWFDPPPPHLPTPEQLDQLRASARFRAPLRALAGSDVGGRTDELARIDAFIHGPSGAAPAVLVLHGAGSSGKSTLAAQYLLERLYRGERGHVFGYLDIDEPGINVSDGVGLVLELAAQVAAQRAELTDVAAVAARAARTATCLGGALGAPGRARAVERSAHELAAALGGALAGGGIDRVTLVLDSFELGLHAGLDRQRFLGEKLAILHAHLPALRTLVVSRAELVLEDAVHLEVGDFDDAAARGYLRKHGVSDEAAVEAALRVGGRSSAALVLAIEVLRAGGAEALAAVEAAADEDVVLALHRALAACLPSPTSALLAPSVVLRRPTAELLATVVAPAIGLGPLDDEAARAVIGQLTDLATLYRTTDDGVLELRPVVRAAVLGRLAREQPELLRDLHARAAAHHDALDLRFDDGACAEAAYHHLALGETDGEWLARLTPAVAVRLRDVLPDLPEATWPLIAVRAQIDLPPARWADADPALHEQRLADRLRELLKVDRAEDVLALMPHAPSSESSPLWRWRGRACALLGHDADALAALERAIALGHDPYDEVRADERLAAHLGARVRHAAGERRAPPWRSGAAIPLPNSLRPRRRADRPWLDDGDLRRLILRAIDGDRPACEPCVDGPEPARAAIIFADATRLNVTPADDDGSVPLLAWIERVIGPPEAVIADLALRFDAP